MFSMTQKKSKTTVLKLAYGPSVRRVRANDNNLGVAEIRALAEKTFPELKGSKFEITYIDDEQDTILVATDSEVDEATSLAASSGKCTKFIVTLKKEDQDEEKKKKKKAEAASASAAKGEDPKVSSGSNSGSESPVMVEKPSQKEGAELAAVEEKKHVSNGTDAVEKEATAPTESGKASSTNGVEIEVEKEDAKEDGAAATIEGEGGKKAPSPTTATEAAGGGKAGGSSSKCGGDGGGGFGGCWKKHRERAEAQAAAAQAAAEELRKGCEAFFADKKVVAALVAAAPVAMTSLLAGGSASEVLEQVLREQPALRESKFAAEHLVPPARALAALAGDLLREGGVAVWELVNELGLFLAASQEPGFDLAGQARALVRRLFGVVKRGLGAAQVGVHWGVSCDRSGQCPIIGKRYNLQGANYDLCAAEHAKLPPTEQALFTLVAPPAIRPFRMLRKLARMAMGGGGGGGGGNKCPMFGGGGGGGCGGGGSGFFGGFPAAFGRWQRHAHGGGGEERKQAGGCNWRGGGGGGGGRRGFGAGGNGGGRRSRSGGRRGFGNQHPRQQQQQQQQQQPQPMEVLSEVLRSFGLVQMGAAAAAAPAPKAYAREMGQLKGMGFVDEGLNQALLEELKGDVDSVVARIIQKLAAEAQATTAAESAE